MQREDSLPDGATQDAPVSQPIETTAHTSEADAKRKRSEARRLRRLKYILPFLLLLVFLVYAFTTNFVPSESMEPNLRPGDHIITMRAWLAYFGGRMPERGDIVVFDLPKSQMAKHTEPGEANSDEGRMPIGVFRLPPGVVLVKRVVGLPGDSILTQAGKVFINGRPLQEDYSTRPSDPDYDSLFQYAVGKPLKLGPDELFLMGDNRGNSEDSRVWGPLKRKNLIGKCVGILFHEGPNGPNEKEARSDARKEQRATAPPNFGPGNPPGAPRRPR